MKALNHISLGAPGLYKAQPEPIRKLTGQPMDVCAFVGVAPRGPCRIPLVDETAAHSDDWRMCDPHRPRIRSIAIPVESFDEYRRVFGGFEGPGLLPYAVAAYFEQGARRAYIVRIVHEYSDESLNAGATAQGVLAGVKVEKKKGKKIKIILHARNEGTWGNDLRARIQFRIRPLQGIALNSEKIQFKVSESIPVGTLLRIVLVNGDYQFRFVKSIIDRGDTTPLIKNRIAKLDSPTSAEISSFEIIEASLLVNDGAGHEEKYSNLGLHVDHPRWIATILCQESQLIWPDISWADAFIKPNDSTLIIEEPAGVQFTGGEDRYPDITHNDFFDSQWDLNEDKKFSGIQALVGLGDLTQIVVPDLYSPKPLPPKSDIHDKPSLGGSEFAECVYAKFLSQETLEGELLGLTLNPTRAADLTKIIDLQKQIIDFVRDIREYIVLLDVPPGLKPQQILEWRSYFNSSYAGAYFPWLHLVNFDETRHRFIEIPPSAVAAGIIAAKELRFNIAWGPANEFAREVIKPSEKISPSNHDLFHIQGINVYTQERDGVLLTGARTLSTDLLWRQLSVRRLILMLKRTLIREMHWIVFEPNTQSLRREIIHMFSALLRRLYRLGAFRGASEAEAFFVRCDNTLNPPYRVDNGQLIVEIGVAPAEPLEFIVLQINRAGDGTLVMEERINGES